MELDKLSDDELLKLYKEEMELSEIYDLKQHAEKILLNSLYGSCGTIYFLYYDLAIAEGITLMGQCYIQKASREAVNYICENLGIDYDGSMLCAGDTDSVDAKTRVVLVRTVNPIEAEIFGLPEGTKVYGEDTIESIYNKSGGDILFENPSGANVKLPVRVNHPFISPPYMQIQPKSTEPLRTLCVDENGKLEETDIEFVMKHKVKKHMYRLCIPGKTVDITEDHSLVVERDGELVEIKPKELYSDKPDRIVYLKDEYHNRIMVR